MNHLNVSASFGNCTCLVNVIDALDVFFVGLDEDVRSECGLTNVEVLKDTSDLFQQWYLALTYALGLETRDFRLIMCS